MNINDFADSYPIKGGIAPPIKKNNTHCPSSNRFPPAASSLIDLCFPGDWLRGSLTFFITFCMSRWAPKRYVVLISSLTFWVVFWSLESGRELEGLSLGSYTLIPSVGTRKNVCELIIGEPWGGHALVLAKHLHTPDLTNQGLGGGLIGCIQCVCVGLEKICAQRYRYKFHE